MELTERARQIVELDRLTIQLSRGDAVPDDGPLQLHFTYLRAQPELLCVGPCVEDAAKLAAAGEADFHDRVVRPQSRSTEKH